MIENLISFGLELGLKLATKKVIILHMKHFFYTKNQMLRKQESE